jgi:hypothetical protein
VLLALGIAFTLLNVTELVFLDGGWPQIAGVILGFGLVGVGIARGRGWAGVGR